MAENECESCVNYTMPREHTLKDFILPKGLTCSRYWFDDFPSPEADGVCLPSSMLLSVSV